MKHKLKQAPLILALFIAVASAHAATHAVLPGTSIQDKVNVAAPEDTIVIFGGTYQQNVTVDKALTLVPVEGESVNITGDLSLSAEGIVVRDINTVGTGITTGTGCVATVIGGQHTRIEQSTGDLTVHSAEILDDFLTSGTAEKTVAFRVKVNDIVSWVSTKSWFGYSEANRFRFSGSDARVVLIGSRVEHNSVNAVSISGSNNTVTIANNEIIFGSSSSSRSYAAIEVEGTTNSVRILNNYLHNTFSGRGGSGVYSSTATDLVILNNIIHQTNYGLYVPFGVDARNNLYWNVNQDGGGVIPEGRINADPLFVDGDPRTLQPDSPCHNAGVEDPLYANRDGSRNSIGPTGGAWYDPEGWTTENPVVISFDLGPEVLLEGVDTEVLLSNGQAVSQP